MFFIWCNMLIFHKYFVNTVVQNVAYGYSQGAKHIPGNTYSIKHSDPKHVYAKSCLMLHVFVYMCLTSTINCKAMFWTVVFTKYLWKINTLLLLLLLWLWWWWLFLRPCMVRNEYTNFIRRQNEDTRLDGYIYLHSKLQTGAKYWYSGLICFFYWLSWGMWARGFMTAVQKGVGSYSSCLEEVWVQQ